MHGELVHTTTSDFVRLHGFYRESKETLATNPETGAINAAILAHGLGGNFYSSRLLLHLAMVLESIGIHVVIANTRGHDMINSSTWAGKTRSVGAAFEDVADSKMDITAWADYLVKRGHTNIAAVGHSLGAIKSIYSQAFAAHPNVKNIIALSATRLSYAKLSDSPRGELFRETIKKCESLVEQNKGQIPIQVPFPFPTWMSPQGYLDKYGPGESFNWLNFIDRIEIPTLLLFGEKELTENVAFEGLRDDLAPLKAGWNPLTIREIDDADHFYTSRFNEVSENIVRWLA